jgi:iron complex transport system ATP-binding protein
VSLLSIDRVCYRYPGAAVGVEEVSMEVARGELVSIVGPNGAGKSTLMRLVARIVEPDSGSLALDGRAYGSYPPREFARRVGYLSQTPEPAFPMRALDAVLAGRAPYLGRFSWESDADRAIALDALALCEAEALAGRFLDEMSGGERKRVLLARVLATDPDLIVLDEPLASLDVAHVRSVMELLRRVVDLTGKSALVVSHELNWAAAYSDRVAVLAGGRLVADAPPALALQEDVIGRHFGFACETVSGRDGTVRWIVPRIGGR